MSNRQEANSIFCGHNHLQLQKCQEKQLLSKASDIKIDICEGFLASFAFLLLVLYFYSCCLPPVSQEKKKKCLLPIMKGQKNFRHLGPDSPKPLNHSWVHEKNKTKQSHNIFMLLLSEFCFLQQNANSNTVNMVSVKMNKCFKSEKEKKENHGNCRAVTDPPISLSYYPFKNNFRAQKLKIVQNLRHEQLNIK